MMLAKTAVGPRSRWKQQRGFTMVELMIATLVLLVGIVAVAQLVPASILSNSVNRYDSSALVIAQRQMNRMLSESLTSVGFFDAQGVTCPAATACLIGDSTQPNQVVGSPMVANQDAIDFSGAQVPGYSFTYQDPNDPANTSYDVRWAVITKVNNGAISGKRFLVGVLKRGGNTFYRAVTLDTMISK